MHVTWVCIQHRWYFMATLSGFSFVFSVMGRSCLKQYLENERLKSGVFFFSFLSTLFGVFVVTQECKSGTSNKTTIAQSLLCVWLFFYLHKQLKFQIFYLLFVFFRTSSPIMSLLCFYSVFSASVHAYSWARVWNVWWRRFDIVYVEQFSMHCFVFFVTIHSTWFHYYFFLEPLEKLIYIYWLKFDNYFQIISVEFQKRLQISY